ncbi:3-hydroxyacyl-CoA dehydrogenase family protein [Rhodobacteraceae bacterium RKSG542]|uniref:3-hydroxyacyl-CoA dehydrogenase family protein n=1 Tax=Pseudovibrio flavus TaxID=2529854 RepID=UPI0012BCDBC8|nr:3-hydroxyacyl-CoA dehydrogenase family protein [Pseudovibrio flavus]MTI18222.1 3-hydroxyacyl-CoA dehydrogenase family protein [Pseudovibrio flavus]
MSTLNDTTTSAENGACAVLGTGTMGVQIAFSLAFGGKPVALWGRRAEALEKAKETFVDIFDFLVGEGLAAASEKEGVLARLTCTSDLASAVKNASFVIEAIVEDFNQKQSIFKEVEALSSPETIIASTTSALCARDLQNGLARPEKFCVAHYIQPAHLMALVEVVPGDQSSEETTAALTKLLEETGKAPVRCPDIPGFLFARIQHVILREFADLVGKGLVTAEACDTIMRQGYAARLPAMGPFEHADLSGLDLQNSAGANAVWADLCTASSPSQTPVGDLFLKEGHTGMRSGQGFYNWKERDQDVFKAERDKEIVRRMKINKGGRIVMD